MKNYYRTALFLLLAALHAQSAPLSETQAVSIALVNNTDLKKISLSVQSDSLTLQAARAAWLPSLTLNAQPSYTPRDSTTGSVSTSYTSLPVSATASQAVFGGGQISAGAGTSLIQELHPSVKTHTTYYQIGAQQPLLKGAWSYGKPNYSIALATIDHRSFTLQQKQQLLATISTVRNAYWDFYGALLLQGVTATALSIARSQLAYDKKRFSVGQASEVDTLSSMLQFLHATQDSLTSAKQYIQARTALAQVLMRPADSLAADTADAFVIADLPDAQTLNGMVKNWDPQTQIFSFLQKRLLLEYGAKKNARLPQMDLQAALSITENGSGWNRTVSGTAENATISMILAYSLPDVTGRINQKQTQLSLEQQRLSEEHYRMQQQQKIDDLLLSWQQDRMSLDITDKAGTVARKTFEASRRGYERGAVDRVGLLQAENDFMRAQVAVISARIALKRLEILFDEMTGSTLSRFGVALP
ncbi:MAG: TolC family protein [Chitinivibrionales bacterium]|nr:TolC family protein [Chitinivibrionales bacterium]